MKVRLGLALLLLTGPLAFAPAPLPRRAPRDRSDEITLDTFQGRWRITQRGTMRADGKHTPSPSTVTHIRIVEDRWTFMTGNREGNTLRISIDASKKPALLNFYQNTQQKGSIYGVGLIRRHEDGVQVLYRWGGEVGRPLNFDPPTAGLWVIYMRKE